MILTIELRYRLGKLLIVIVGQDRHEDLFQLQTANLYFNHVLNYILNLNRIDVFTIILISQSKVTIDLISRDRDGCEGVIINYLSQYFAILDINNETRLARIYNGSKTTLR
jgi:hypothetical protein